jgi:hypothetical protein
MKYFNNNYRNRIGDERLEKCLRIATTELSSDINRISDKKQARNN